MPHVHDVCHRFARLRPGWLCHGNSVEHALRAKARQASCRCDGILPLCGSFGPEDPQCGSGDEMTLRVEGVVNRTVHAEEALSGSSRLEPLQLALASSDCLMRILRPIVFPKPLLIATTFEPDVFSPGAVSVGLPDAGARTLAAHRGRGRHRQPHEPGGGAAARAGRAAGDEAPGQQPIRRRLERVGHG